MAAIPQAVTSPTVAAIYAAYEANAEDGRRSHLGASLIGTECERALWLGFRWATARKLSGRMLRLLQTGHAAEETLAAGLANDEAGDEVESILREDEKERMAGDIRSAGIEVHTVGDDGRQFHFRDATGHFGGSMDGCALGILEAPLTWHVLEFKTASQKAFKHMLRHGVQKSKPLHYAQCQTYMHKFGMTRTFYLMVNKNTDELYAERIHYDKAFAERLEAKAERIIASPQPLARAYRKPDFYMCKLCDHKDVCWNGAPPERNCRTCLFSVPTDGGQWLCRRFDRILTTDEQKAGCDFHLWVTGLIDGEVIEAEPDHVTYRLPSGETWRNEALF